MLRCCVNFYLDSRLSLILKEAHEYYNSNRGTVYCAMLDASKAFDRVQYCSRS